MSAAFFFLFACILSLICAAGPCLICGLSSTALSLLAAVCLSIFLPQPNLLEMMSVMYRPIALL